MSDIVDHVLSRGLPKTRQSVGYKNGDDYTYRAGWDMCEQFIEKTIDGDQVIIDNATGLMWPKSWASAACNNGLPVLSWDDAIDTVEGLTFAGLSWRLPNSKELYCLVDLSRADGVSPAIPVEFTDVASGVYWSSSSCLGDGTLAYYLETTNPKLGRKIKTDATGYIVAVRSI